MVQQVATGYYGFPDKMVDEFNGNDGTVMITGGYRHNKGKNGLGVINIVVSTMSLFRIREDKLEEIIKGGFLVWIFCREKKTEKGGAWFC